MEIHREGPEDDGDWNIWEVATLSLKSLIHQQWDRDRQIYKSLPGVTLHHMLLSTQLDLNFDDFDHANDLISEGREIAEAFLLGEGLKLRKVQNQHCQECVTSPSSRFFRF